MSSPNSPSSLPTIDFMTALGGLLRDGARRDSFRANARGMAEQWNVRAADRAALLELSPVELEAQADVLLRKRLDRVKRLAPELCAALAARLWPLFRAYAREQWQENGPQDALKFLEQIAAQKHAPVSRAERNRLRFLTGTGRLRLHVVRDLPLKNRRRAGVQVLLRTVRGAVREAWFYPGW